MTHPSLQGGGDRGSERLVGFVQGHKANKESYGDFPGESMAKMLGSDAEGLGCS